MSEIACRRVSQPRSTAQVHNLAWACTMSCMIDEPRRRRDVDVLERSYKIPTSTEPTYNLTDERLFPVAFTIEVAERTVGKLWIELFSSQPSERSPYGHIFSEITLFRRDSPGGVHQAKNVKQTKWQKLS